MRLSIAPALAALLLSACASLGLGEHDDAASEMTGAERAAELTRLYDANYPARRQTGAAYFNPAETTTVYFATDSHVLTRAAQDELDVAAVFLARDPFPMIVAEGYADERGNREYNLRLATRRAIAVRDYLVARGVAPDNIRVAAFGIEQPVADCPTEACWRRNRRVTVIHERTPS